MRAPDAGTPDVPAPSILLPHKSRDHVRHVSAMLCMICAAPGGPAHHLLKGWCRSAKTGLVMRRTQTDVIVVPLCPPCHTELHDHRGDEDQFFFEKLGHVSAGRGRDEREWLESPYWVDLRPEGCVR